MKKVIKCAEGGEIPKVVRAGGTTQVLMKKGGFLPLDQNSDGSKRIKLFDNKNGDVSTESVIGIGPEANGKFYNIPTVINGKRLSEQEAIEYFRKSGEHTGEYDNQQDADNGADSRERANIGLQSTGMYKDGGDIKSVLKEKGIDPSIVRKGIRYKGEDRGDYTTNFAPKIGVRTGKLIPLADYIKQKDAEKATADAAAKPSYQLTDQKISWEQPIQTPTVQNQTPVVNQASGSQSTKPIKTSPSNNKTNTQKSSNSSPSQTEQKAVVPPVEQKSFPTNQKFGSQPYNDDMGTNSITTKKSIPIVKSQPKSSVIANPKGVPDAVVAYADKIKDMSDDDLYTESRQTFSPDLINVLEQERSKRGIKDWNDARTKQPKTIPATQYPLVKSYNFSKPEKQKSIPSIKSSFKSAIPEVKKSKPKLW